LVKFGIRRRRSDGKRRLGEIASGIVDSCCRPTDKLLSTKSSSAHEYPRNVVEIAPQFPSFVIRIVSEPGGIEIRGNCLSVEIVVVHID